MASSHNFTHPRQVSARMAPSLMFCCAAPPPYSSTPLRRYVCSPSISLVVNMYIRIFCDHLNILYNFRLDRLVRIVLKSGWNSTARMLRLVVSLPSLPLTPRRHRQADGQLSSLYPPSPSFSSFGAACCVKLCCSPPSLVRNTRICGLVYV